MSSQLTLNLQYNLSKKLSLSPRPVKLSSFKDRQLSDLGLAFRPNNDEMKRVFDKISNDSGKITARDLQRLLEALGKEDAEGEAKAMVSAADLNKDGFIDLGEFMEVHKKGVMMREMRSAFHAFDQDGDGRISPEDLRAMFMRLGERCGLEECRRMVRQVDQNGDGLVDMDEFMAMMTRTMKLA